MRVSRVRHLVVGVVIAVAPCVSLSRPSGTNVPVVRGTYKSGSEQQVRILLTTPDSGGELGGTGGWAIVAENGAETLRQYEATSKVFLPRFFDNCSAGSNCVVTRDELGLNIPGRRVVVRALSTDSFITWAGKRYRGDLLVSLGDSGLVVINRLSMDSYLRGVVPLEIGNRTAAEMAAVQAQAVAARTYAYKHLNPNRAFDMYSTVQDQVYGGVDAEKPQSDSAIMATADVVVLYNGQPITTPYHSTCGGSTGGVSEVWYDTPDA